MNGLESLALSTGASIAGQAANQIGYGLGKLTGYNKSIADDQYNQQKRLTELQGAMNLGLMKESFKEQKNLWDSTNAEAQVEHYKAAGLNPALIYAKGGGGGVTGGGSASVSGASASGESERMMANNATTGMGLQLQKIASEIKLNDSIAKKNEAEASQAGANTETINLSREWLVEKLKQEGKGEWIDNIRKEYQDYMSGGKNNEGAEYSNDKFGGHSINQGSLFDEKITSEITQALASSNNANAQALLTNEKAQGYFKELLNDTVRADAAATQAAAQKLSSEFNTGEMINWKTWKDLAESILKLILK